MKFKELVEMMTTDANPVVTDDKFPVAKFPLVTKNIKKRLKKKNKNVIQTNYLVKEDLNVAKFFYKDWKHDKNPKVAILDYKYKKKGEKNNREDVLGWNVNYYANKKEALDTINDIDSFARMLSANKLEKYKRMKYFFPEQAALIRRYKKEGIKKLKTKDKDEWFWKKTSLDALEQKDKDKF